MNKNIRHNSKNQWNQINLKAKHSKNQQSMDENSLDSLTNSMKMETKKIIKEENTFKFPYGKNT